MGLNFYLKPDKIRGLSHADYNFLSVLVWSYLIIFVLIGTYYFLIEKLKKIDTQILRDNFILSSALLLFFGYLGSSMPFINFVNYYFFGQTSMEQIIQTYLVLISGEKVRLGEVFPKR